MKPLRITAALTLAMALFVGTPLTPAVRAEPAPAPFATVPSGHWPYRVVRELAESGYFTGYPASMFADGHTLTRYDFSVALQRLVEQAERRMAGSTGGGEPSPGSRSGAQESGAISGQMTSQLVQIQRLAEEFAGEYAGLGQDPQALQQRLAALGARLIERTQSLAPASQKTPAGGSSSRWDDGRARSSRPLFHRSPAVAAGRPFSSAYGLQAQSWGLLPSGSGGAGILEWTAPLDGHIDVSLALGGSDPLAAVGVRPQAGEGISSQALDARLALALGKYLVSGIYKQVGSGYTGSDLWLPRGYGSLRGLSGFGGSVRAPVGNLFAVQLEGISLQDGEGELSRDLLLLKSGIQMTLGRALTLGFGYERLQSDGLALAADIAEQYNVGLGHRLGRNARLELLYQFTNLHRSLLGDEQSPLLDVGAHSAVTQFQIRF